MLVRPGPWRGREDLGGGGTLEPPPPMSWDTGLHLLQTEHKSGAQPHHAGVLTVLCVVSMAAQRMAGRKGRRAGMVGTITVAGVGRMDRRRGFPLGLPLLSRVHAVLRGASGQVLANHLRNGGFWRAELEGLEGVL